MFRRFQRRRLYATVGASPDIPTPDAPLITNAATDGETGVAYSFQYNATGGVGPYTYIVQSGTLPDGLTLSSSGLLSGTPVVNDTFTFVIRVVDANGIGNTQNEIVEIAFTPFLVAEIISDLDVRYEIRVDGAIPNTNVTATITDQDRVGASFTPPNAGQFTPAVISAQDPDLVAGIQTDTSIHVQIDSVDENAIVHTLYGDTVNRGSNVADWVANAVNITDVISDGSSAAWHGRDPDTTYFLVVVSGTGVDAVVSNVLEIQTAYASPSNPVIESITPDAIVFSATDNSNGSAYHKILYRSLDDVQFLEGPTIDPGEEILVTLPNLDTVNEAYVIRIVSWDGSTRFSDNIEIRPMAATIINDSDTEYQVSVVNAPANTNVTASIILQDTVGSDFDSPAPTPGNNEPAGFSVVINEDFSGTITDLENRGWNVYNYSGYEPPRMPGGGVIEFPYVFGQSGGSGPRIERSDIDYGPEIYIRIDDLYISPSWYGHEGSGVNKVHYLNTVNQPNETLFTARGWNTGPLYATWTTQGWPMGAVNLIWNAVPGGGDPASPYGNYANPTAAEAEIVRGVNHQVEHVIYYGTPGNADARIRTWLNGVLVLDYRDLAALSPGEVPRFRGFNGHDIWGGTGNTVPVPEMFKRWGHLYVSAANIY